MFLRHVCALFYDQDGFCKLSIPQVASEALKRTPKGRPSMKEALSKQQQLNNVKISKRKKRHQQLEILVGFNLLIPVWLVTIAQ